MTGGRVRLDARISPVPYSPSPRPAVTECTGDDCCCRRDPLAHPPRLLLFDQEAGAYREEYRACTAIWAAQASGHASGRVCGDPATHQVADVLLCEHHYRRMREWMNTRDQRDVIEAARTAQRIHENQVRLDRERSLAQRTLAAEEAAERAVQMREQAKLQRELDRERVRAEEAARAESSRVYFVRRESDGLIKIGTSRTLAARMVSLKREHGPLHMLATTGGAHKEETALHRQFGELRAEGEWFRPGLPLLEHVYALMKERPLEPAPGLPPIAELRELSGMIYRLKMVRAAERRKQREEEEKRLKRQRARDARKARAAAVAEPAA